MDISRYNDPETDERFYTDGERHVRSVTTILDHLEEDTTGLQIWRRRNDGRDENPHHEHLLWYKTFRGTLIHYHLLRSLVDDHDHETEYGGVEWGDAEQEAHGMLLSRAEDDDVIYSLLKDHELVEDHYDHHEDYPDVGVFDIFDADKRFALDAWSFIIDELDIERLIAAELFLIHPEHEYGGQLDLLYEDADGNVVAADLKTSSSLRQKHIIQILAYGKAVEAAPYVGVDEVDRHEIIRIHPETQSWSIHSHDARTDAYDTKHWFKDKYGNWEYSSIEEQWQTFLDLLEKATDDADD